MTNPNLAPKDNEDHIEMQLAEADFRAEYDELFPEMEIEDFPEPSAEDDYDEDDYDDWGWCDAEGDAWHSQYDY